MARSGAARWKGRSAPSGLIVLLTDFGEKDVFVGVMKAVIAGIAPAARVLDLCHGLTPFDPAEAAFVLRAALPYVPAGAVVVVVVDPGVGSGRRVVAVRTDRHVFLAPDNGVLAPIVAAETARQIVSVENTAFFLPSVGATFHGRDVFAPVAAHLSLGVPLERLGPPTTPAPMALPEPHAMAGAIEGTVVLCDRFGNLITNIPASALEALGAPDALRVRVGRRWVRGLSRCYADAPPGRLLALVSSFGTLEIASNGGSAAHLTGAGKGARVRAQGPRAL